MPSLTPTAPKVKVLVDVNIFEDVYRHRSGWTRSLVVIARVKSGRLQGYVSALTPAVLHFFRKRHRPDRAARQIVRNTLTHFEVVPLTADIIDAGYKSALPDFEDAIQFESAKQVAVDYIVTRNKRHYRQKAIAVVTPEELLARMGKP